METAIIISGPQAERIATSLNRLLDLQENTRQKPQFQDDKMTVAQAAKYSDYSYKTLCKLIHEKKIRCWGSGRKRFLLRSEVEQDVKNLK